MIKKIAFLCFVGFLVLKQAESQKIFSLSIVDSESNVDLRKMITYKSSFADSLQRERELTRVILLLWERNYIAASCDSLSYDSDSLKAFIKTGKKYNYIFISDNSTDMSNEKKAFSKRKRPASKKNFSSYAEMQKHINKTLTFYENNGYPFITVRFDSILLTDSSYTANLKVNKNTRFVIDSVVVRGSASSSDVFIVRYLNIRQQSFYNESQNKKIKRKLKELDFIREMKPSEIEFYENKAKIILFVDKVKANQFDGIIGFMPNDESGKLTVTGDVKLTLKNSFNRGEMLSFKWNKYDKLSQNLRISFGYPFLLLSPFGIDVDYSLYKKDTSYITNKGSLGFKYLFDGNNHLKAFFEKQNTSLINSIVPLDENFFPVYNGSKSNLYGLEYKMQNFNNIVNPTKGYNLLLLASAGNKEIIKNNEFPDSVYNNIKFKSSKYLCNAEISYFIPIVSRSCILLNTKSALLLNDYLFENELFRIGGLKTLRGFDEESILASFYAIFTVEYRYLFDEYSYLNVFWNGCHYEKNTIKRYSDGNPFGFGAGINIYTKLGLFSLNYALGKNEGEPIYFRRAKVHFGIINYF
jgi:hypothetical protein